ncbi:MAG TPA: glycoside hydrolase family 16 protein [Anaerohalosphaeraceae bacterium]|nr:glycoside hydrolase family 16 protein [Anaerohalosphaeraceae bacterium]
MRHPALPATSAGQSAGAAPTCAILPCRLSQPAARPGLGVTLTYRWQAAPLDRDLTVFVHVRAADGRIALQDDHTPPIPTSRWSGRVEYERTIAFPTDMPEGTYSIVAGLYDRSSNTRHPLKPGPGVTPIKNDPTAYKIAAVKVDARAPMPKLPPPTLNLDGWRLTFSEEFDGPLDISAWGPGTRWIAHTPYAGDFGDARFTDPQPGFPFTVTDGVLRIEARKENNRWRSGLICSVDKNGDGFAQQYGYFEMRAKFPPGPGTWPAFWLLGLPKLRDPSVTQIEIDVVEQYGRNPWALHTNVHLWYPDKRHTAEEAKHFVPGMTEDFHTYGVMVDEQNITFYYDGVQIRQTRTPPEANVPLYILANLALGAGWPIDKTPNPSYMYIDYIRAYAKP